MHRTIHPGTPEGEDANGVVDVVGMELIQRNRYKAERRNLAKARNTRKADRAPMQVVPADIRKVLSAPIAVLADLVLRALRVRRA